MRTVLVMAVAVAVLAGCARLPPAGGYPAQPQARMQAAAHWEDLAATTAERLAAQRQLDTTLAGRPVYVRPQGAPTAFNQAFHTYLTAHLGRRGVALAAAPEGAATLAYTTQVVAHRGRRAPQYPPGTLTLAGALVALPIAAGGASLTPLETAGAVFGGALLAETGLGALDSPTGTDLIVATRIEDGGRVLFRAVDTFYINDADFRHYEPPAAEPLTVRY